MRYGSILLVLVLFGTAAAFAQVQPGKAVVRSPRIEKEINRDWTFTYVPSGVLDTTLAAPGYDDGAWLAVAVPHTWSTYETTGEVHPFIYAAAERDDPYWWYGWGWYRKRFIPADSLQEKKLFAEFDGVQKYSRVYLNGEYVGDHEGGYTSFSFDLTPYVRWGEENMLAVAASNRRDDPRRIPPMTAGNFNVYGGLYRDVRLVVKSPLHIPFQGSADHEGGTFVTTPRADSSEGVVRVQTFVRNDRPEVQTARLRTVVVDREGEVVTEMEDTLSVAPGEMVRFDQTSAPIPEPRLWSPETPYVYVVHSEVYDGDRLVDVYESPLGFRTFYWDHAENTLYLNGRPVAINGTNRHQEYPWLGDAIPDWITRQDMEDIRHGLGHNFIRAAHYPNDPFLYHLTDSLGIITVEEVPNIKSIDFSEAVQERNVRAMVRRDRNHPSILFWSMGNESDDAANSAWAWEEDTTRIIHLRKGEDGGDYVTHTHEDLDLENLLRVTVGGWYTTDDAPDGYDYRPENGQHASTERWQHEMAQAPGGSVRGSMDEDVVVWLYADHGADREYLNAPLKHVNPKGWVDLYRTPKQLYYLWQAHFTETPMVHVHPYFWRQSYLGHRKKIVVDSNADTVELFVNGGRLGTRRPKSSNHHSVAFDSIEVVRGTLLAVATKGDVVVRDSVTMAGTPARLALRPSHDQIVADRSGLAVVRVDVADSAGVPVLGSAPPLTWSVEGPGRLVGPPVYESDADKHEAMGGMMYIAAPISNLVRSTSEPGTITVRVSAPELEGAEVTIRSVPPRTSEEGIEAPPLSDASRHPVARDTAYVAGAEMPEIEPIRPARQRLRTSAETPAALREAVDAFVMEANPDVDTTTAVYRAFAEGLVGTLQRTGGELVEDDYNVATQRYNDALRLVRYLDLLPLHLRYKQAMREYYAEAILERGTTVDLQAERERLSMLGRGPSRVVLAREGGGRPNLDYDYVPDLYRTGARDLEALLALAYPEFAKLAPAQQRRLAAFVAAINPHAVRPSKEGAHALEQPTRS